jgi:RNA polymerase subunit RPABC4/transcription elongation factor Spt4
MTSKLAPMCGQHNREKKWQQTVFEYSESGISIRIPNVDAWVCPEDGEASFTPEMTDELIITAKEFIQAAKKARARRSVLTEYVVAVQ